MTQIPAVSMFRAWHVGVAQDFLDVKIEISYLDTDSVTAPF